MGKTMAFTGVLSNLQSENPGISNLHSKAM
jgi:hypothetical protein